MKFHQKQNLLKSCLAAALVISGCTTGAKPVHYLGDEKLEYYREATTEISYPTVVQPVSEEVSVSEPPRTISSRQHEEIWDLPLEQAIQYGLSNSDIIRSAGTFLSPNDPLLTSGANVDSIYDVAIQETNVLFGSIGTEAALASFDTTWSTSMFWGRNSSIQNSPFSGGSPGSTLTNETGNFQTSLSKQLGYGGSLTLSHSVDHLVSNSTALLFPSSYSGNVQAEYRQQLLAGSGSEFVGVAGPVSQNPASLTGVRNGVLIARINGDITITNFEAAVRNLLKDIEDTYWDLYLAYRNYDTAVIARNSAMETWRVANAKLGVGGVRNFSAWEEAQARDRYFETDAQTKTALNQLYQTEQRLRSVMGLPINDGQIIRPMNEPITALYEPDWYTTLAEALTERIELRRQKWQIKSLELQAGAARSLTQPRLDFVATGQVNMFGNRLFGSNDAVGVAVGGTRQRTDLSSAYESLSQWDQTGWQLGFELTMPLGYRQARAQVKNLEWQLTKARKVLSAQELQIGHELAASFQDLESSYQRAVSNFNRRQAAQERARQIAAQLEVGSGQNTIDLYLRAQESLANAENAYHQSIVDYNKALVNLYFRKGTLLAHNSINLAEGRWNPKAYEDAYERARHRGASLGAPLELQVPAPFASDMPVGSVSFIRQDDSKPIEDVVPMELPEEALPEPVPDTTLQEALLPAPPVSAEGPTASIRPHVGQGSDIQLTSNSGIASLESVGGSAVVPIGEGTELNFDSITSQPAASQQNEKDFPWAK